jgi:hypothetical protein
VRGWELDVRGWEVDERGKVHNASWVADEGCLTRMRRIVLSAGINITHPTSMVRRASSTTSQSAMRKMQCGKIAVWQDAVWQIAVARRRRQLRTGLDGLEGNLYGKRQECGTQGQGRVAFAKLTVESNPILTMKITSGMDQWRLDMCVKTWAEGQK